MKTLEVIKIINPNSPIVNGTKLKTSEIPGKKITPNIKRNDAPKPRRTHLFELIPILNRDFLSERMLRTLNNWNMDIAANATVLALSIP